MAALTLAQNLGFAGGVTNAARLQFQAGQDARRTRLAPKKARWDRAVGVGIDDRFRDTSLARAAAAYLALQRYIPHGNAVDENIDIFMFDYIVNWSETHSWEPRFRLPKKTPPTNFAIT